MTIRRTGGGGLRVDLREQVGRWCRETIEEVKLVHQGATIGLYRDIIITTPVATGEAVGGWVATYGKPHSGPSGRVGRAAALAALKTAVKAETDAPTFLSNSVRHIAGLEYGTHSYGFSPKAPAGMVRINASAWRRYVSEQVAAIRSRSK